MPNPRWADERFMIAFARLVTHYFSHAAWLEEDEMFARRDGWPASLACSSTAASTCRGRRTCAWELAQAWPGAELHFVAGGHTGDAEMERLLLEATDRFASRR